IHGRDQSYNKDQLLTVITKQSSKTKLQDCRVKRGANCGTNHYLVMAKLIYG
ncbi:hypothetical protein ILUMI_12205, partial [Ignelater luminosus]